MESKEVFFTWKDVKRLFKRQKKSYLRLFVVSFFCVLFLYLVQPVRYEASATFKQSTQDQQIKGQSELLLSVLQSAASLSKEESAQPLLTSRTLIREVVETLGMQIQSKQSFILKCLCNITNNLFVELGFKRHQENPFQFSYVRSETMEPLSFFLKFQSSDSFEVMNAKKQKIGEGVFGKTVQTSDFSFKLERAPKTWKPNKLYAFQLKPWTEVVKKIRSHLIVKASKKDKNILSLDFTSADPLKSSQFVNGLMLAYQNYLKKENEEISHIQMGYLEKRQDELINKYEEALTSHMHFLGENLENSGFMTLKQESQMLEKPSEEYLARLYDLDLQLSRLNPRKGKKQELQNTAADLDPLEKIYAKREELLLQTDLKRKKSLDREVQDLLFFLSQKNTVAFEGKMPEALSSALLQGLEEVQKGCRAYQGDPLAFVEIQHKKQWIKKQVEEEWKQKIERSIFHELEGIAPETVQKLYVEYNEQLDSLRVHATQLREVKERILLPEFEIASLSGLLTDGVSQEMVQKAGQKTLELQDRANYSLKDIERIQSGLDVQKRFLFQHIEQILSLEKIKIQLIEEKILSLGQTSSHQLEVEKELIQKQLGALKERMKSFPEKWKKENELMLKRDLALSIIEGLSQLAESKNIDAKLFSVGSKPIDSAIFPYKPHPRMAFSFSFLIALFLFLSVFVKDLLLWLSKGRVITESFALSIGLTSCGFFRKTGETQETVRKICAFLGSSHKGNLGSCVLMLNVSELEQVAHILSLRGSKVLVVECFADLICKDPKNIGLYDYLSGPFESPTILKKEGFDRIPSGIYQTHFVEWLCRKKFSELVKAQLQSYDFVLLSMKASASDAVLEPLKSLADLFVLHVCDDVVWEEVAGWAQEKPASLAVVFSE